MYLLPYGSMNLAYGVRFGPTIEEWKKGKFSETLKEDDKVLDENSPIFLSEDKFLFIRIRRSRPESQGSNYTNISIGPRLSWQKPIQNSSASISRSDSDKR
jgi:hypothetical protein